MICNSIVDLAVNLTGFEQVANILHFIKNVSVQILFIGQTSFLSKCFTGPSISYGNCVLVHEHLTGVSTMLKRFYSTFSH